MRASLNYSSSLHILFAGLAACTIVLFAMGRQFVPSCAVGVAIAVANWLLLCFVVRRLTRTRRPRYFVLLFLKLAALLAAVAVLVAGGFVEGGPFLMGLAALVCGPFASLSLSGRVSRSRPVRGGQRPDLTHRLGRDPCSPSPGGP
ncbi:MAG: hypothetical protein MJD61_03820 [Proteobacteria bacterium]|nr:hypothetical protein [Pseudomonadota bacterium]